MKAMGDTLRSVRPLYWASTALITLLLSMWVSSLSCRYAYNVVAIAVAALGTAMVDLSWRGAATVLGVTLLVYIAYCLRDFGPL